MASSARWRRLDRHGRDSALLLERGTGWRLTGTAVFDGDAGAVTVAYEVDIDRDWRTERGRISGADGARPFRHVFTRGRDGWDLDGRPQGLGHVEHLDFAFTPATNLAQIRSLGLDIGAAGELAVAWFDIGASGLLVLPQQYRRLDATHYAYASPAHGYSAKLELADHGFVKHYPGLWELEG